jgi:secretion/DNA translocation related CpaE-like protein
MSAPDRVLLLSRRDALLAAVLRLAALSGTRMDVWSGTGAVPAAWRSAAAVLVDPDSLPLTGAAAPPRRPGVQLVTLQQPDADAWRCAVEVGADQVVVLPEDSSQLLDLLGAATEAVRPRATTVTVTGGCGGAGASTLAAALAVTSAREAPTVLLDADPHGGGLDVLLGVEQTPGARWPELVESRGRLGAAALSQALVPVGELRLLSWDRSAATTVPAEAMATVLDAAGRAGDLVVVDVPRRWDDPGSIAVAGADLALLVVPATVRAVASAAHTVRALQALTAEVRVVVRDPAPGGLGSADVGRAIGLSVAAEIDSEPAVRQAADRGEPPVRRGRGSLHDACRALLALTAAQGRAA